MLLLLDRPNLYERCAADHDYCRKILDESLRLFTPATIRLSAIRTHMRHRRW